MLLLICFFNSVSYVDSYQDAEKTMMNGDHDSDSESFENSPKRRRTAAKIYGSIPSESELELDSDVPLWMPSNILSRAVDKRTSGQESAATHASQTPRADQPPIASSSRVQSSKSSNQETTVSPAALALQPVLPRLEVTDTHPAIQSPPNNDLSK
jgi:hypothetical protein